MGEKVLMRDRLRDTNKVERTGCGAGMGFGGG